MGAQRGQAHLDGRSGAARGAPSPARGTRPTSTARARGRSTRPRGHNRRRASSDDVALHTAKRTGGGRSPAIDRAAQPRAPPANPTAQPVGLHGTARHSHGTPSRAPNTYANAFHTLAVRVDSTKSWHTTKSCTRRFMGVHVGRGARRPARERAWWHACMCLRGRGPARCRGEASTARKRHRPSPPARPALVRRSASESTSPITRRATSTLQLVAA